MSKIRRMYWLVFVLILMQYCNSYSQNDSTGWSYFPYKTGDMWEYWAADGVTVDTAQIINIKDSVSPDGKIHLTQHRRFINPIMCDPFLDFFEYTIDTAAAEVIGPSDELRNVSVYKFNVQEGDQWMIDPRGEMATVMRIYEGVLFDRNTKFIEIRYHNGDLVRYNVTLAQGFGLVFRGGGDQTWYYYLKGAVINGVLYGDTTNIITSVDDKNEQFTPQGFELRQNYPNPFNPTTTITFNLNVSATASLIIYDALGREIRRLIDNKRFTPGPYEILWDGKTNSGHFASTGVYYYRLLNDRKILTRSMIFLK